MPFRIKLLFLGLFYVGLFWAGHYALQQPQIYNNTLCDVLVNIEDKHFVDIPFVSWDNQNFTNWDAAIYNNIVAKGYKHNEAYNAFFPAFPLLWKAFNFSPFGIALFNSLLYCIGFCILASVVFPKIDNKLYLLLFSAPVSAVFFIPYSESLFFLFMSIGIVGMIRKNLLLIIIGFLVVGFTRSSSLIVLTAFFCTLVLKALQTGNLKQVIKEDFWYVLSMLGGIIIAIVVQLVKGAPSWNTFMEVQGKYWGQEPRWSLELADWSSIGFPLNMLTMLIILCALFPFIINLGMKVLLEKKEREKFSNEQLLTVWFCVYAVGMLIYIYLWQRGNIHGLFRYVACVPLAHTALMLYIKNTKKTLNSVYVIVYTLVVVFVISLFFRSMFTSLDAKAWSLLPIGLMIPYVLLYNRIPQILKATLFVIIFVVQWIWNMYLFNWFLSDGWIFT